MIASTVWMSIKSNLNSWSPSIEVFHFLEGLVVSLYSCSYCIIVISHQWVICTHHTGRVFCILKMMYSYLQTQSCTCTHTKGYWVLILGGGVCFNNLVQGKIRHSHVYLQSCTCTHTIGNCRLHTHAFVLILGEGEVDNLVQWKIRYSCVHAKTCTFTHSTGNWVLILRGGGQ